jgi:hypothetical protein
MTNTCRSYLFYSSIATNPSQTCISMASTNKFLDYLGDPSSYTQISNATFYNTTAAYAMYAWINGPCSTSYMAICEVPWTSYACPPSPPTLPPPPGASTLCEALGSGRNRALPGSVPACCCSMRQLIMVHAHCTAQISPSTARTASAAPALAAHAMCTTGAWPPTPPTRPAARAKVAT